ncbi:MAG: DUF1570 domain-containing protein [Phycisphaerales bacterium JB037]
MSARRRVVCGVWPIVAGVLLSGCSGSYEFDAGPTDARADSLGAASEPFDPVIRREAWTYAGRPGRVFETAGYRIFTTESRALLQQRIPAFLERALIRYTTALGDLPRPEAKLETYILASRREWELLTRELTGPRAETYLKVRAGGFAEQGRALLFNIGWRNTFSVASHEGWHQYTQRVFRAPLPIWLEEGIAAYMEGYRWDSRSPELPVFLPWANVERFDRLRAMVDAGRVIPLRQLLGNRPQDLLSIYDNEAALDYYSQVWALVHFLREGEGGRHRAGLEQLLQDAASGALVERLIETGDRRALMTYRARRVGPDLFRIYFDDDLENAEREYDAFVRAIVAPGGRDRIVAGRSPVR